MKKKIQILKDLLDLKKCLTETVEKDEKEGEKWKEECEKYI